MQYVVLRSIVIVSFFITPFLIMKTIHVLYRFSIRVLREGAKKAFTSVISFLKIYTLIF